MGIVNVVLDANALVAALKFRRGSAFKLLTLLTDGVYVPNISVPLFAEYESVTKRNSVIPDELSGENVEVILDYLLSRSSIWKIFYLWCPYISLY